MRKQEVSQLSVVFLLSALHFNPYAEIELRKVWLLPHTNKMFRARQNRENWQPAHKPNVWFVRPAKTDYRQRSIHKKNQNQGCGFTQMKFLGQPRWISTKRGELKRNRCLQHSAWPRTVVQQAYTLFAFVSSASLLFYTFSILHTEHHERLTLLFNYCFTYTVKTTA